MEKVKRGAPRRPKKVRELTPEQLEALADEIIAEREAKLIDTVEQIDESSR